MKVYISADIEGITGTTHWDETEKKHTDFGEFREQMTAEVAAACAGALEAGATEILVKDAHASARNIIAERLPVEAKLWRGWSGHPYLMMDGIDSTFQAALMIGYHSRAGSGENPLSHSMSLSDTFMTINGRLTSEFMINTFTAALENVPVVFVAGDAGLCADAKDLVPALTTVAVKQGIGGSTINIHPNQAIEQIRVGAREALLGDPEKCRLQLPAHFDVEISFREHAKAYSVSFYPGASLKGDTTIRFSSDDYFEVLRLFKFVF